MKKIALLLISLFCMALVHAQTSGKDLKELLGGLSNEDFFTKSELVFEGRLLKMVATYNPKGNREFWDTYGIYTYKVNRVYKGDISLEGDTLYLVREGALLGDEVFWLDDKDDDKVFIRGDIRYLPPPLLRENGCANCDVSDFVPHIYFLTTSDIPENGIPKQYETSKKYKFLHHADNRLYLCGSKILGLDNLVFQNRNEFYDYIRQFEGFTVPENIPMPQKQPDKEKIEYRKATVIEMDSATNKIIQERWGEGKKNRMNPVKSGARSFRR